jgi:uncharacterized protein
MPYYIYKLRIVVDRAVYEPYLPAHLEYLDQLRAAGSLVLSGPFTDRTGGMVMVAASTPEAARAIAEADPLVANRVDEYELHEWCLTGGDPAKIMIEPTRI